MLVRHDWSRGWRQAGGAVGIKQSVGGRPDLVAPCARATLAGAHLPPGLMPLPLISPFPTHGRRSFTPQAQLLHPDFPIVTSLPVWLLYYVPFSLSTSAKCRHSFRPLPTFLSAHPPLGPACPLIPHSLQPTPCRLRIAFGRLSSHLLPGQQLHSYHIRTYILRAWTVSSESHPYTAEPAPVLSLNSQPSPSSPTILIGTTTSSRHFTNIDRQEVLA
jgi:hypothetical protein